MRANDLVLSATHLHNVEVERAGCAWDRCEHSIKVKKPFHRLLLKLVSIMPLAAPLVIQLANDTARVATENLTDHDGLA